jgi:hypothetical protein
MAFGMVMVVVMRMLMAMRVVMGSGCIGDFLDGYRSAGIATAGGAHRLGF